MYIRWRYSIYGKYTVFEINCIYGLPYIPTEKEGVWATLAFLNTDSRVGVLWTQSAKSSQVKSSQVKSSQVKSSQVKSLKSSSGATRPRPGPASCSVHFFKEWIPVPVRIRNDGQRIICIIACMEAWGLSPLDRWLAMHRLTGKDRRISLLIVEALFQVDGGAATRALYFHYYNTELFEPHYFA